ncbi:MAG: MarR family winged helix-turn-helix transcriptional regulator [Pseudomonadota bacterium]
MTQNILKDSTIHLLHRAGQCASDIFAEEISIDNLTPRQFAVLYAISKNEGLNQTHLVQQTGVDRSTLADIIQRMLKKGLIKRSRTEKDARAYAVYLTEDGKTALEQAGPAVSIAEKRLLEVLPEDKRIEFIESLSKIIDIAENNGASQKSQSLSAD